MLGVSCICVLGVSCICVLGGVMYLYVRECHVFVC